MGNRQMPRAVRMGVLVVSGIAVAFAGRIVLNALMRSMPEYSKVIDVAGQFVVALLLLWFFARPILVEYGVIRRQGANERDRDTYQASKDERRGP